MNAKDKAKELVDKFKTYADINHNGSLENAKQCALIAVDEILKSNPESPNNHKPFMARIQSLRQNFIDAENYWQEVKQEINNL